MIGHLCLYLKLYDIETVLAPGIATPLLSSLKVYWNFLFTASTENVGLYEGKACSLW